MKARSALFKLHLALGSGEAHNTIFIAQSAVDDEFREAAGLSTHELYPVGRLGTTRVVVIPDVSLATTAKTWRELLAGLDGG